MRRWNSQKKSIRILSTRKCKTLCVIVYHIWLCTYLGLLPSNFYLQFGGKSMGRVYSNELGSFFCQQTDFFSVQRLQCVLLFFQEVRTLMLYLCLTCVIPVLYQSFHVIIFQKLLISYPYPCQCSCLCLCFLAFLFYIDIRLICIMIMVVQVKGGSIKCLVSSFFVAHRCSITHMRDFRHVCYDIDAHAYLLMYVVL